MFAHLHAHSYFSFESGVSSPEALLDAAAQRGFKSLACTDTNGVYGAVEFQQAARARGIRPILGAHLVFGDEEAVVLATDEKGWGALCRATSMVHWKQLPIADQLATDREGLIVLSSNIPFLERVVALSGPTDLYAELRPGKERHAVGAAARRLGIRAAVTNAVKFANPEDFQRHRLRVAIARNITLSQLPIADCRLPSEDRSSISNQQSAISNCSPPTSWLRQANDLSRFFPDCPEALSASEEIAERCEYLLPLGRRVVAPRFAEADDAFQRLRTLAYEGAERRYGTIAPVTRDRLEHELAIIGQMKFADYFLVVHDIVQNGPTHCGRGSVANSIVSYALGITHVDPLGAGLLFERFLNPERRDPPDIDLDFPWDERDRVLAYVFRKYPNLRSAMVANHNCFRLRGALREVAKVHGRPPGEVREITRRFPWFSDDDSLEEVITNHPNFQGLELPAIWGDLARMAQPLVGTPRHLSLHPGGVVIVPTTLTDYVPVERAAKVLEGYPGLTVPVIQFEKDGTEDAGLVKIDLLGNRSLAVIRDAIAAVKDHTGRQIDYTTSDPEDDEPTRALFRTGQTMGVFYTESPASRQLCAKSQADTFDLLVLNTSIIRPASNRFIRIYLERLHGKPYEPLDPCLRDTLAETFGVMVYQEDVVNVSAIFAGMQLATGDGLRKALSKKRPVKHLASYAEEFFSGAAALGRDIETAKKVWEMVMSFAGYSFCKGHSCSYIRVAQHSCYLRAHYPAEFMAGVLANGGGFYHPFAYVAEAMRMGLTILPPDVNASDFRTTGRGREVRIGLQFVKGLSAKAAEQVLAARPFTDFADFRARTGLGDDDCRTLIKVGALDSIRGDSTRPMLLWAIDATLKASGDTNAVEFDIEPPSRRAAEPPPLREYTTDRRRRAEYELLGFTTDSHPMHLHAADLARFRITRSTELADHVGESVLCCGMLTTSKPISTITEEPMEFATFDDGYGLIETVLFPRVFRERGHVLFDQGPFIFRGKVDEEFGAITVAITGIDRLERMLERAGRREGGRADRADKADQK